MTSIDYEMMKNNATYQNLMVNCFSLYKIINHNFLQNVKAHNVFFTAFVDNESLNNDQPLMTEMLSSKCKCCPVHKHKCGNMYMLDYLQLPIELNFLTTT